MFLLIQACAMIIVTVDNIVITQKLGPEAVTQYAVPMRMFMVVRSLASMFVIPLWPAYSEALARGDAGWVKRTAVRSVVLTVLIFSPLVVGFVILGKPIVHVWVGPQIHPSFLLLWGAAVWVVVDLCGNAVGIFLMGANRLKFLVIGYAAAAVAVLPAKVYCARAFGIAGVVWATAVITALGTVASVLYAAHVLRQIQTASSPCREAGDATAKA